MAIERTLTCSVCFRTGTLLLPLLLLTMMMVTHRANATETGSDERQGASADEHNQQESSVAVSLNRSSAEQPGHLPTYLKTGKNSSGIGCVELRSKRYVSDGRCTSIRPLMEVVCSGLCLPVRTLPWYVDYVKAWAGTSQTEWRCVDDVVRKRKLTLLCEDGTTRSYRVRVVKNCRCKQVVRRGNAARKTNRGGGGGGGKEKAVKKEVEKKSRGVNGKKRKQGRLTTHKDVSTASTPKSAT